MMFSNVGQGIAEGYLIPLKEQEEQTNNREQENNPELNNNETQGTESDTKPIEDIPVTENSDTTVIEEDS